MKSARILGALLQGAILAALLILAIVGMVNSYGGMRIFRYQGF